MYGLEIIVGEFGAGKTFYTHRRITGWRHRDTIRVGNYSSPDFHLQFRSIADLMDILQAIYDYKKDPKNLSQEIIVVVDEASLYFGNREFKTFPKKLLSFLVQLRKLNVHAIIVLQDLKMGDINFRRLCYNVRKYYTMLRFLRMYKDYELLSEDANLNDPVNSIMSRPHIKLGPWLTVKIFDGLTSLFSISSLFFGSSFYDTNEVIIPEYDILDREKMLQLFPYTRSVENNEDYKILLQEKEKAFFDLIAKSKNRRMLKHYKKIHDFCRLV